MKPNFTLTINELPKTKRMQVDERHPLLTVQQNVPWLLTQKFTHDEDENIK